MGLITHQRQLDQAAGLTGLAGERSERALVPGDDVPRIREEPGAQPASPHREGSLILCSALQEPSRPPGPDGAPDDFDEVDGALALAVDMGLEGLEGACVQARVRATHHFVVTFQPGRIRP
jgi:hypothetical protein